MICWSIRAFIGAKRGVPSSSPPLLIAYLYSLKLLCNSEIWSFKFCTSVLVFRIKSTTSSSRSWNPHKKAVIFLRLWYSAFRMVLIAASEICEVSLTKLGDFCNLFAFFWSRPGEFIPELNLFYSLISLTFVFDFTIGWLGFVVVGRGSTLDSVQLDKSYSESVCRDMGSFPELRILSELLSFSSSIWLSRSVKLLNLNFTGEISFSLTF